MVRSFAGVPYIFGGKSRNGIDCSGLVTCSLFEIGGPDLRATHNTDKLWVELPQTIVPEPGDLAQYEGHVVILVRRRTDGPWVCIGANGGKSGTLTVPLADAAGAFVRLVPSHLYRPDFRGFRSIQPYLKKAV